MVQPLNFVQDSSLASQFRCGFDSLIIRPQFSCLASGNGKVQSNGGFLSSFGYTSFHSSQFRPNCRQVLHTKTKCLDQIEDKVVHSKGAPLFLEVQTLRSLPLERLFGEAVIVRFDSGLFLDGDSTCTCLSKALSTINYLLSAGAKLLLVGSWGLSSKSSSPSTKSLADYLSSLLHVQVVPAHGFFGLMQSKKTMLEAKIVLFDNIAKLKEELSNCPEFAEKLSSGAGIFVNDAFSLSHKILASTVGVARFCYSSVAGFHFEEELFQLMKIRQTTRKPFIAVIGGAKFSEKAAALHTLASKCDGLIFVGMMAFQVMHALGLSVPSCFVEQNAIGKARDLIHLAQSRNIPVYFPSDFWCENDCNTDQMEVFTSDSILTGWSPIDLGPLSLKEIFTLVSRSKMVLWVGPVKFGSSRHVTRGASELALMLDKINKNGSDVIVAGNAACRAVADSAGSNSAVKMFKDASVVWEFLKGRTLPGVAALDRAYPFCLDWNSIFADPRKPLVVDIGSGSGLFIFGMARLCNGFNYLGLEINEKLVIRCLHNINESEAKNKFFMSTNATSTFRSIISSYPGDLVLVSIQCPNPDFNREEHRWRMVQRTLVEAIIDLLAIDGKVFLQSDVEGVNTRMKEQFITYGKDKIAVEGDDGWLPENPFGVRSDWEQHAIDRGAPMYRAMLRRVH